MEICITSLKKTHIKSLKRKYGKKLYCNNKPNEFITKVDQSFLKGQYGSTSIVPDSNFSKDA